MASYRAIAIRGRQTAVLCLVHCALFGPGACRSTTDTRRSSHRSIVDVEHGRGFRLRAWMNDVYEFQRRRGVHVSSISVQLDSIRCLSPRSRHRGEPTAVSGTSLDSRRGDDGSGRWVPPSLSTHASLLPLFSVLRSPFSVLQVLHTLKTFSLDHLVDVARLGLFLDELERMYTVEGNPYHTSVHAADVVATLGTMMEMDRGLFGVFDDTELLSWVIAGAGHDVGHQGVTNAGHARLGTAWYRRYGQEGVVESINERAHADITLGLMRDGRYDFLVGGRGGKEGAGAGEKKKVLGYIERMILQTDITWHADVCDGFGCVCRKEPTAWTEEDRVQILGGLLHFADLSNPGRPWGLCKRWGELIYEEHRREVEMLRGVRGGAEDDEDDDDDEDEADGSRGSLASSQIAFIRSTIQPFCQQVSLVSPAFASMIGPHLEESVAAWQAEAGDESCK